MCPPSDVSTVNRLLLHQRGEGGEGAEMKSSVGMRGMEACAVVVLSGAGQLTAAELEQPVSPSWRRNLVNKLVGVTYRPGMTGTVMLRRGRGRKLREPTWQSWHPSSVTSATSGTD